MATKNAGDIRTSKDQQEAELEELAQRIDKLRVAFDRFFMGLERLPPLADQAALERDVRRSQLRQVRKTSVKFRFQNLQARLVTYASYWNRILRMIEEGTFKRDRNNGLATPAPPGVATPTQSDGLEDLYAHWNEARQQVGVDKAIDFEKFKAKIVATRKKHLEHFSCSDIEYAVKVKDGKVSLTAKPIY
jgi:hypothetical protein